MTQTPFTGCSMKNHNCNFKIRFHNIYFSQHGKRNIQNIHLGVLPTSHIIDFSSYTQPEILIQ